MRNKRALLLWVMLIAFAILYYKLFSKPICFEYIVGSSIGYWNYHLLSKI